MRQGHLFSCRLSPQHLASRGINWMFEEAVHGFGANLTCPLCQTMYTNPYTAIECGHVFCRYYRCSFYSYTTIYNSDCIYEKIQEKCACPLCQVPIFVKNLKKNSSFATIVACVRGIEKILEKEKTVDVPGKDVVMNSSQNSVRNATPQSNKKVVKPKPKSLSSQKRKPKTPVPQPDAPKSFGFVLTGLSPEDKQMISATLHTIGSGKCQILSEYDSSACTHVIAQVNQDGLCQRTIKYLLAVLDGKWIVSIECTLIVCLTVIV